MAQGVDESRVFIFPLRLKRHWDPPSFLPTIVNNSIVVFYLRDHRNIQTWSKPAKTTSGLCFHGYNASQLYQILLQSSLIDSAGITSFSRHVKRIDILLLGSFVFCLPLLIFVMWHDVLYLPLFIFVTQNNVFRAVDLSFAQQFSLESIKCSRFP